MKKLITVISLILLSNFSATANSDVPEIRGNVRPPAFGRDVTKCEATKQILKGFATQYLGDLSSRKANFCYADKDCTEKSIIEVSLCAPTTMNRVTGHKFDIMTQSAEYQRVVEIYSTELKAGACRSAIRCSLRPLGQTACRSNKCVYLIK